jgi:hypothetical protein
VRRAVCVAAGEHMVLSSQTEGQEGGGEARVRPPSPPTVSFLPWRTSRFQLRNTERGD